MTNKPKILITDDEQLILEIFSRILRKDFDIHTAHNVESFYQKIEEIEFDIFLMDVSLKSSKNGLQLVEELRGKSIYQKTPIVVITAHAFSKDEHNALNSGASLFLRKPVENSKLLLEVQKFFVNQ